MFPPNATTELVNLGIIALLSHLCVFEHAEVGVRVERALLVARLFVQLGRLAELALVRVHVPQEHVTVVLPALLPLLKTTTSSVTFSSFGWGGVFTSAIKGNNFVNGSYPLLC